MSDPAKHPEHDRQFRYVAILLTVLIGLCFFHSLWWLIPTLPVAFVWMLLHESVTFNRIEREQGDG